MFTCLSCIGQINLVPNGSFEEYNNCPDYASGFYIDACKFWTTPSLGSPDYFNRCSTEFDTFTNQYVFSVPENYIGYQEAWSGDGYAGILFSQAIIDTVKKIYGKPYSEYIQIKLNRQLESGYVYQLQFFINNSGPQGGNYEYAMCPNSIGALFTSSELNESHDSIIQLVPQYNSDLNDFYCDTIKWYESSYIFQAQGNERYLTIGVFTPMPITKVTDLTGHIVSPTSSRYYFIDGVSVIELGDLSAIKTGIPNIFTPNGDGENDVLTMDFLGLEPTKITIVNRWGNVVYQTNKDCKWDGTHNEDHCTDGVYYYLIEFTEEIKINGFVHLIR